MKTLREQILELSTQGLSYNQISEKLGCSKGAISYHLNPKVKAAVSENNKKRRQQRLDKVNAIKESKPCMDCNQYFEGFLMDFDHLPGNVKVKNVSYLIDSVAWSKVLEEISKCEVVCCMCHRRRTKNRWLTSPLGS